MQPLDLKNLKPDALTKAISAVEGKFVSLTGYIRAVDDDSLSFCSSRSRSSHVEIPRTSVLAAFRDEAEEGRVTLLIAKDAQVAIVRRLDASEISTGGTRCEPSDVGVAEARPYSSIDKELGKHMAEIAAFKAAVTASGSRDLKCAGAYYEAVIGRKDADEARRALDLCLAGIDEPDDPTDILW